MLFTGNWRPNWRNWLNQDEINLQRRLQSLRTAPILQTKKVLNAWVDLRQKKLSALENISNSLLRYYYFTFFSQILKYIKRLIHYSNYIAEGVLQRYISITIECLQRWLWSVSRFLSIIIIIAFIIITKQTRDLKD